MQFEIGQSIEVLAQTPEVLRALLQGKSDAWLECRKGPDAFSARDVVGHLMHAELTDWIPRARMILEEGETRAFEPFDRFGFQGLMEGKSIGDLLDEFAALRARSLEALAEFGIGERELELAGRHPEFGRVTLRELLATWVVHDLGHMAQIVKTMANEYRDAVGPWRAYVSILH